MTDTPRLIGRTVQDTEIWLNELAEHDAFDNKDQAFAGLRAVLHRLRDRLPLEEAVHLSAQLPTLIRGVYFEGWKPEETPDKARHPDEFFGPIDDELGVRSDTIDSEAAAKAVFQVLKRNINEGEVDHVTAMLPEQIRERLH